MTKAEKWEEEFNKKCMTTIGGGGFIAGGDPYDSELCQESIKEYIRTLLAKQREECSNKVNNLINIHHEANARMHALILEIRAQHKREVEALTLDADEIDREMSKYRGDQRRMALELSLYLHQKLSEARSNQKGSS